MILARFHDGIIKPPSRGQTLVEFAFVCMVIFVILAGAFYVGHSMYQGQMAAEAVHLPAMPGNKYLMANDPSAIEEDQVLGYVNAFQGGGFNYVDDISYFNAGTEAKIILGTKTTNMTGMGMPDFTFTVSQGLQFKLLEPASAGAPGMGLTWLPPRPGNTPPTWNFNELDPSNLPIEGMEYFRACADRNPLGGEAVVRSFVSFIGGDANGTYMSRTPSAYASVFKVLSFVKLGEKFKDECDANRPDYKSLCQEIANDLVYTEELKIYPEEDGNIWEGCTPTGACYLSDGGAECAITGGKVEVRTIKNPPGASGLQLNLVKWPCSNAVASAETIHQWANGAVNKGVYDSKGNPLGLNQPLPAKFVTDCVNRKVGECMFNHASDYAEIMADGWMEECKLTNPS